MILNELQEVVPSTRSGLFALVDTALVTLAMRGTPQLEQASPIRFQLKGAETLAILFDGHQPVRIADVWGDDPKSVFFRSRLDDAAARLLDGIASWMWVPLAVRGRMIGCVGLADPRKNYFTAHHADLALKAAHQIAIAMVNAELYQQAQAVAVVEERQRLARDLHDAINQSLFSAGLIAEVLPRLWDRDQAEARRSLEDLRRLTRGAQAEMRALLAELRPATLTDSNLGDLLHLLGNAFSGRTNIPVTVTVAGEFILPTNVQVAFYRVCQEALFNVGKHAHASRVEINLHQARNVIEMDIHDNGQGFDIQHTASGHYGLSMMRERAESVGARLSVSSQPEHGTQLSFQWTNSSSKGVL